MQRHYHGTAAEWEAKLARVMRRMEIRSFDWNWDRHGAWITFRLGDQSYRLEQSLAKARARKVAIANGVDCLAQLVLTLEDLARMAERGIYELPTFMRGFQALPAPTQLPECLQVLGFTAPPASAEEVKDRYRRLAKAAHPDQGGDPQWFRKLTEAAAAAEELVKGGVDS